MGKVHQGKGKPTAIPAKREGDREYGSKKWKMMYLEKKSYSSKHFQKITVMKEE